MKDQPVARQLPTQNHTNTKKCRHISVLRLGFEPTIPVSERAKTLRVIDRTATIVIDGKKDNVLRNYNYILSVIN
jgi:hypothetical protein